MLPSELDLEVRLAVLVAMGKLGERAAPYVEQIVPLLDDPDKAVTKAAGLALSQLVTQDSRKRVSGALCNSIVSVMSTGLLSNNPSQRLV